VRAIGQSKLAALYDAFGVVHERGIARVDTGLRTSNPQVYAAGDCLFGGGAIDAMVVSAAQAGKDVAASVDRAFRGLDS
jgi:glutamate synthase (NADPH/NADH) small chain